MRLQSKHLSMIVQACGLFLLCLSVSTAQTKKPGTGGSQTTNGLTGATNTAGSVPGLIDKSVMSTTLPGMSAGAVDPLYEYILSLINKHRAKKLERLVYASEIQLRYVIPNDQLRAFLEDDLENINILKSDLCVDKKQIRPEGLLFVAAQALVGSGGPYYVPGVLFSSGRTGFDIGGQSYIGPKAGYGISVRKDIQPLHQHFVDTVYAYNDLASAIKHFSALIEPIAGQLEAAQQRGKIQNVGQVVTTPEQQEALKEAFSILDIRLRRQKLIDTELFNKNQSLSSEFISLSKAPQLSFLYSYRTLESVGDIHSAGLSLSNYIGVSKSGSWGATGLINVQGVYFAAANSTYGPTRSAVQTDIALIFQNATFYEKADFSPIVHGRWSWELGIEYRPWNQVDRGSLLDGFVRYRFLPRRSQDKQENKGKQNNKYHWRLDNVEITGSIGKGVDDHLYVSFGIGKSFPF
jgi:hypothetical protein